MIRIIHIIVIVKNLIKTINFYQLKKYFCKQYMNEKMFIFQ